FIARGAPSIYYGTEIGLEGENDPQNRDLMDFSQLGQSDLDERISALASARDQYRALTHGAQQMLSRPSDNGANVMAFRRTLEGEPSVVIVMNNADEAVDLSQIAAGGIPLLGTFASDANLTEVSGRQTDVSIVEGLLVGTIPARSVIAVAGAAGSTTGGSNEGLETVTNVTALPGGAAVKLSWTPVTDDDALGYRIYYMPSAGGARVQSNFAPLGVGVDSTVVRGLDNGISYDFEVVTVDGDGRESTNNPTVTATPDADAVSSVTFVVDARSQGNAPMQIRRFDTGSEIRYPMTPVAGQRGFYETTLELPLFREISFKFANDAATAKNGGYEGVGTNNRTLLLDESTLRYEGVYNFIEGLPPGMPDAAVTGTVTSLDAPVANALIDAALDDRFYFAFTFEDGTFYLPLPSDTATTLTASAPGLTNASLEVTAPADDVMLELAPPSTRYTIDGDLSDWDGVPVLVNGPEGFDFGFGANNLFIDLYADADDDYLYLGYRYRAEGGNAMIVFVDSVDGGVQTMNELDAFAKWATFTAGIDAIVAQDGGGVPSVRRLVSTTETMSEAGITATVSTGEDEFAFASEVAIPWAALGLDAKPASIDLYAGVFGGSLYGAGDIVPNRNSTPVAEGNTIQPQYDGPTPRLAEFETPLQVMLD
ncbi:MAG: alpha-amylase, partial [Deinococcota bacterium]